MSTPNKQMTGSYKAVFIFSIAMAIVVLLSGIASGSKTSGFGVWIWGYTAWLMHKRNNTSLILLQRTGNPPPFKCDHK